MKYVTIKDVAKKLNVSISSVSRAFNDKYDIKKETKELILKTAEEMGYFPNPIAKKLSQKKTFNIGIVVPEFINEFYSEIIIAIQDIFTSQGYQILVMQSDENQEQELANVKTLMQNMMDGLIIAPTAANDNMDYYLKQRDNGFPIVFMNRVEKSLKASKILFDNEKWSFFATEHLIAQGNKRIFHLAGHKNLCVSGERIKGFIRALKKHNIPKENYKIIETGLFSNQGIDTVKELINSQNLPDALFCENDHVAMGAIKILKDSGYRVPEDITVMGFTETRMAELITPQLSSVRQPTHEIGKKAAELLLKHINNGNSDQETIIMDGVLNIRKSTVRN
ncbi:LacI family DNA-binding transcriptional regulator [Maribacter ulvicola]|uniref:Transcriptional regulator, LacI family n=1 Tax=Maribacter ulvicola TaxID=228959 RepID=A0A1N6S591_9FLAO|nr:LacI family DNA-binding transcriptional regulator [Maribacter ulvicola]SIQ36177.1 transcriptional regulator, LacI family [Maribacter ulvicola]